MTIKSRSDDRIKSVAKTIEILKSFTPLAGLSTCSIFMLFSAVAGLFVANERLTDQHPERSGYLAPVGQAGAKKLAHRPTRAEKIRILTAS